MLKTTISTTISFIVGGTLTYCINTIKNYKNKLKIKTENENIQNTALLYLLQAQLTNTYFVYNEMGEINDYIYKNWLNSFKIYKQLGGNDYVDTLKQKMENWVIVKTDILSK